MTILGAGTHRHAVAPTAITTSAIAGVALITLWAKRRTREAYCPEKSTELLVSVWRACLSLIVILRRRAAAAGSPPRPLSIRSAETSLMTARQNAPMPSLDHGR